MDVEKIQILSLRPGDALVVSGGGTISADAAGRIAGYLQKFCRDNLGIDDVPVMVMGETTLRVLRAEK